MVSLLSARRLLGAPLCGLAREDCQIRRHVKGDFGMWLLLTLCLVLAWVAPVSAQPQPIVTFHDLTDTVTVTGSGTVIPISGEVVQFAPNAFPPAGILLHSTVFITEGVCA